MSEGGCCCCVAGPDALLLGRLGMGGGDSGDVMALGMETGERVGLNTEGRPSGLLGAPSSIDGRCARTGGPGVTAGEGDAEEEEEAPTDDDDAEGMAPPTFSGSARRGSCVSIITAGFGVLGCHGKTTQCKTHNPKRAATRQHSASQAPSLHTRKRHQLKNPVHCD